MRTLGTSMRSSRCLIFLIIAMHFIIFARAQSPIDSLLAELQKPLPDTQRVLVTAALAFEYRTRNVDSTYAIAARALRMAKELDYNKGISRASYSVAVAYHLWGEFDTAMFIYDRALILAKETHDLKGQSRLHNNIGLIHWNRGVYDRAIEEFQRSLLVDEQLGDSNGQASALNNMGLVYRNMKDVDNALNYFQKSRDILLSLNDGYRLAQSYNNIGLLLNDKELFDEALESYRNSVNYANESGSPCHNSYAFAGMANTFISLGRFDSVLFYAQKVLDLPDNCAVPKNIALAKILIGRVTSVTGNAQIAEQQLLEGLEEMEKYGLLENAMMAKGALYELYKEQERFEEALYYHELKFADQDSLVNDERIKTVGRLEAELKAEREKQIILKQNAEAELVLQQEIQRQRYVTYGAAMVLILLIVLAIVLYRSYRRKQQHNSMLMKTNRLIEDQKEDLRSQADMLKSLNKQLGDLSVFKENMTNMIAHDMKNSLNTIIGLSSRDEDDTRMERIAHSGRLMLGLVTNMLDVQKFEETEVKLSKEEVAVQDIFEEARQQIILLLQMKSLRFETQLSADLMVNVDRDIMIRVVVNLLTNAIKYTNSGKLILLKGELVNNNDVPQVEISIADEGKGIEADQLTNIFERYWQSDASLSGNTASTGLGLTFCKLAVEAHDGQIRAASTLGVGTTMTITLAPSKKYGSSRQFDVQEHSGGELSEKEKSLVRPYAKQLLKIPVYQVGKIKSIIASMDDVSRSSTWRVEVDNAVFDGDEESYLRTIRSVLGDL